MEFDLEKFAYLPINVLERLYTETTCEIKTIDDLMKLPVNDAYKNNKDRNVEFKVVDGNVKSTLISPVIINE